MRVTDIEVHRVTLPYDSARADELIRYHDLTGRTIYIAHTDSGLTGLGESEGVEREEVLAQYIGSNPFDWIGDETSLGLGTAMRPDGQGRRRARVSYSDKSIDRGSQRQPGQ